MFDPSSRSGAPEEPVILDAAFYQRPAEIVAPDLLGKLVMRETSEGLVGLRLVETEAYLGVEDPACHTFGGRKTARVSSMWGKKGCAYVYLIYGLHHCLNVVCGMEEDASAVLLRAGVVVWGEELMRSRRRRCRDLKNLLNGPGKLCQALAVDRSLDAADFSDLSSGLWIADDGFVAAKRAVSRLPRIGIDYAGEAVSWPLRYCLSVDSPGGGPRLTRWE